MDNGVRIVFKLYRILSTATNYINLVVNGEMNPWRFSMKNQTNSFLIHHVLLFPLTLLTMKTSSHKWTWLIKLCPEFAELLFPVYVTKEEVTEVWIDAIQQLDAGFTFVWQLIWNHSSCLSPDLFPFHLHSVPLFSLFLKKLSVILFNVFFSSIVFSLKTTI